MLIEPYDAHTYAPKENVNERLLKLEGELDEEEARATLGEFLYYNLQFTARILMGVILRPFQAAIIRGWFEKNFSLAAWGRGCAKSTLIGYFAILYAIFNPGQRILIVSSNFRSSRRILENLEMISKRREGLLMRQIFEKDLSRRNDIFQWVLKNGSSIVCLPLANGEGLRGQRANVLIVDEALLVSRQIIEGVLMPFLAARGHDETTKIFKTKEREDELIRRGEMTEVDRSKFKSKNKMILLSSASYQGEYFYEVYSNYLRKIQGIKDPKKKEEEKEDEGPSHFVSQMSYEVLQRLAPEILDKSILDEVESGNIPQSIVDREYRAIFVQDSGGLFRMSKMKACTIEDGMRPCVEIVGEPGYEYVVGIDPNVSASETADHFAISVLKIVAKKDGKKIGMLVHSYAAAGVDLTDHIKYFLYILEHFNVVYVAEDATQGANQDFINVCNESEIFKNAKIQLNPIEADFGKEEQSEITKQIQYSYSKSEGRIVQKQSFHSAFQNAAVEHLQACVDFGNIIFAGHALAIEGQAGVMSDQNIGNIHKEHKQFMDEKDGNPIYSFIERQDYLIDLTKSEMAIIQVSVSQLGNKSYDIAQVFKRSKNINRPRKDLFSSLMLANWGLKLYLASKEIPPVEQAPFEFELI